MSDSPYMTPDEAAAYLRCSAKTIYRRLGIRYRFLRDGRRLLVVREDVESTPKAPKEGKNRTLFSVCTTKN